MFKLIIGNHNYSSWSLRPWLAAKQAGLSFEEISIPPRQSPTKADVLKYSPSGKVPCLVDGEMIVWESLSICEYLAEKAPSLWPSDEKARAEARSIACEIHFGFNAMRQGMPFDVRASLPFLEPSVEVKADVARIISIWESCRRRHGGEGPFLFGHFTNADAIYAPAVFRFLTYHVELPEESRKWVETMAALPAMQEWREASIAEAS
ncbi:MAG: glutathione S-transferase family protein [Candidatus Accumulibacter sp.]|jgi:glutathione S-transferase|nr:glutathione S-transferase family protein [Accumulibacter sp.]